MKIKISMGVNRKNNLPINMFSRTSTIPAEQKKKKLQTILKLIKNIHLFYMCCTLPMNVLSFEKQRYFFKSFIFRFRNFIVRKNPKYS